MLVFGSLAQSIQLLWTPSRSQLEQRHGSIEQRCTTKMDRPSTTNLDESFTLGPIYLNPSFQKPSTPSSGLHQLEAPDARSALPPREDSGLYRIDVSIGGRNICQGPKPCNGQTSELSRYIVHYY